MKRILFLSYYFEPDLCAGSFRNSPLAKELADTVNGIAEIDVFTTIPNRYETYQQNAPLYENHGNLHLYRIKTSKHRSGIIDQIRSFTSYFFEVKKRTRDVRYDLVFASSSRLFTAFLGFKIAKNKNIPFYIDVRDIFYDSMKDLLNHNPIKWLILPFLKYIETRTFSNAIHINLISGGFSDYFRGYKNASFTTFTNGIDDEFLDIVSTIQYEKKRKVILYAGNIGEGQGLHKFVPSLAKNFEDQYDFIIIGDGGAKKKLIIKLQELNCTNVQLKNPVSRTLLLHEYDNADFFLIHLNDYNAFEKVLPSKIFELGSIDKPIIAGVGDYASEFIKDNISNVILVKSCDIDECTSKLKAYKYKRVKHVEFIEKFSRRKINVEMAASIASYLVNSLK